MSETTLHAGISYNASPADQAIAEDLNTFPDTPADEVCIPCLVKSFAKGFINTFWEAVAVGFVVGVLATLAVAAGIVSAPVLLIAGLIVGGIALAVQVAPIVQNWDNMDANQKAEAVGEVSGGLAGGALGGGMGSAAGGAMAGQMSAAAASMGGGGLVPATVTGPSSGAGAATAVSVAGATSASVVAGAAGGVAMMSGEGGTGGGQDPSSLQSGGAKDGPYSHLEDPPGVGEGKDFTPAQKAKIIEANKAKNGGVVKSDQSGKVLEQPQKSQKGVTPSPDEWQIDHVQAKDNGGTNSYKNAQVLSRSENRAKSNK